MKQVCLNRYHRTGPATQKDPSPYDLSLESGTCNIICLDDLGDLADALMDIKLHR